MDTYSDPGLEHIAVQIIPEVYTVSTLCRLLREVIISLNHHNIRSRTFHNIGDPNSVTHNIGILEEEFYRRSKLRIARQEVNQMSYNSIGDFKEESTKSCVKLFCSSKVTHCVHRTIIFFHLKGTRKPVPSVSGVLSGGRERAQNVKGDMTGPAGELVSVARPSTRPFLGLSLRRSLRTCTVASRRVGSDQIRRWHN